MGAALENIGFSVLRAENVSRREMNRQLQLFASRLEAGDEALFFFAGHGVEIAWRNYLLPIDIPDANPGQEDFVKAEAIAVDQVLDTIRARGTRVSI
ncbi:MAG: caspase family protein, partial [Proteobacteria bacterium]|nr:caspase family protein [Pseudomonadota bacterium]